MRKTINAYTVRVAEPVAKSVDLVQLIQNRIWFSAYLKTLNEPSDFIKQEVPAELRN
jgi:hypothetical protein